MLSPLLLVLSFALQATPAEEYQALLKAYQEASGGGASSDEERLKLVARVYKNRQELSFKFIDLAERHPKDPVACAALVQAAWQVNTNPWPVELAGRDVAGPRALALLQRDHLQSDALGPLCRRVSYGFDREYESFLRAVLEKNPRPEVQAQACVGLAHFLFNRLQRVDVVREMPGMARDFENLYGADYLAELRKQDRAKAEKEAEAFFERAIERYSAFPDPDGSTVGDLARAELHEMRHLSVGKEAPEIDGEDQDGRRFKLSDYRGKVVLLDFWSEY